MAGLIRWFLASRVAANLLMLSLLAAGVAALFNVTVRTFPEIAVGTVTVTTVYPGASPSEVADAVLTPIEEQLQGLEGVRKLTSTASRGLGTVSAELTRGADIDEVENDIETEIARIGTLPEGAERPRIAKVEPTELAVEIALHGPVPRAALKALAERVRDELTDLDGISQVAISGVPADQIDIEVTRETLESYGMGPVQLAQRISSQSLDLTGGQIDTGQTDLQVRTEAEAEAADQYRDLVIFTGDSGATVRLGAIARISDRLTESAVRSTLEGEPAVYVSVNRAASEQVPAITETALNYLRNDLRPSLPDGIEATVWRNQGDVLQGRIDLLVKNGLIGAALILLLLTLFLDLRIAAWVAAGVAVAFIGAFAPMLVLGPTINQLSLFGFILALGIVVDDAIVVGENVFSRMEETGDGETAAREGTLRVWRPILFSVTTTIFAFVPLLFLPGASGSFISPVAAVVIYVLTVSLIESFLILPSHLSHISLGDPRRFSPRRATEAARRFVDRRFKRFREGVVRRVVTGAVRHPVFTLAACTGLAVAGAGLLAGGVVKFTFFPQIEGNFVSAELRFPEGITTLSADVDNAVTTGGAETAWLMQTVVPQLKQDFPGLEVAAGGEQEEAGRFSGALAFNFGLALFAIYAILALAFGSYGRPAIVLLVIPFGALGAVVGHAILGIDLTLLSMFGIVGLAGVIVNDSLLIVDFIQEGEAAGKPEPEAIVDATLSRFRPIMLTTLTTFLGITPLVLETSVQAQFLIPTAVSLGAGVLFVSVLQMVLVPAYAALYAAARRRVTGRGAKSGAV